MAKATINKLIKTILFIVLRDYIIYFFLRVAILALLLYSIALPLHFKNFPLAFLVFFSLIILIITIMKKIDTFNDFWKGIFLYYTLYEGKSGKYYKIFAIIFIIISVIALLTAFIQSLFIR